ncbi:MAG: site-2 protease family protein [Planctomycetes bacterium]|nr:site-2 protease family protein [Planctomycetota bacterium]
MRWSFKAFAVAGIGVHIHLTFLLLVGYLFSVYLHQGGVAFALQGTAVILSIFACVLLHELGHALTAGRFGIRTRDITLLPIGGVARLERIPTEPLQELLIAVAGPAVNVVIALGLIVLMAALRTPFQVSVDEILQPRTGLDMYLRQLLHVNLAMVVFNMIPAFPMDGGRILRSVLAIFLEHAKATRVAAAVGQGFAVLFALLGLGVLGPGPQPILVLIAVFVFLGAAGEAAAAQMQAAFRGLPAATAMLTEFKTLRLEETLGHAVEVLLRGSQIDFPVLDDGRVAGVLTRQQLVVSLREGGPEVPVREVPLQRVEPVEADQPLYRAYEELMRQRVGCIPLTRGGAVVGWITSENIAELALVRDALARAGETRG